jgi:hypothetical protein
MRVSKKVRRLTCELLSACAALCLAENRMVMIGELAFQGPDDFLEGEHDDLDFFNRDQVGLLAALAFREAQSDESDPALRWAEMYAAAEAMLREGFTPKGDG